MSEHRKMVVEIMNAYYPHSSFYDGAEDCVMTAVKPLKEQLSEAQYTIEAQAQEIERLKQSEADVIRKAVDSLESFWDYDGEPMDEYERGYNEAQCRLETYANNLEGE